MKPLARPPILTAPAFAPQPKRVWLDAPGGERRAKRLAIERSEGLCEGCGLAPGREFAHRVAEGQGGPWDIRNGLRLCGHGNTSGCHGWSHSYPEAARVGRGWALLSGDDFTVIPAKHWRLGWVLLDELGGFEQVEAPVWT